MEDDAEKEELRTHLDIIPGDDVAVSAESLATKYQIVDWKTHVLSEARCIMRSSELMEVLNLTRYLQRCLMIMIGRIKDDEVWKAQQDYTLISWRLFDSCGIHVLLMDTGIAIHMLVEKTYPLT
ncbi:hypothetical protein Tco_0007098 [Tanacetum coccineum]